MPIYEYVCDDCDTRFERIVINKAQEIACPKCSSTKATIQLSVFASKAAHPTVLQPRPLPLAEVGAAGEVAVATDRQPQVRFPGDCFPSFFPRRLAFPNGYAHHTRAGAHDGMP
jgi:putative FmdB family regulatory protein